MPHIHKRLSDEQARIILGSYCKQELTLEATMVQLGVARRRLFDLLKRYRENPDDFTIAYSRESRKRLTKQTEQKIQTLLEEDRDLIVDRRIPVTSYNYAAIRDRLESLGRVTVSHSTILRRAKEAGFYIPKKSHAVHDRLVLTNNVGELIQHDSSHHLFSPYAREKWYLITSLDDFSRRLLFADLFLRESSWAHISAVRDLVLTHGCPLKYYVDQHSIFRFVERRDSAYAAWNTLTDGVSPQWKQSLERCGIGVAYALSPQAKGKIERPYRWLQDRIVRRCAQEHVERIEEGRHILKEEIKRYNERQRHSTTTEIPILRFEQACKEGRTFFRPHHVEKPLDPVKDIFCLKTERVVNMYRRISLGSFEITVPKARPRHAVQLNITPDAKGEFAEVRIWCLGEFLGTQTIKAHVLRGVHF
jgi:hypothetical protein